MVGPLKQLHKSLTLFACAIFCRCDGRHGGCVVQVSLCVSLRLFNGIKTLVYRECISNVNWKKRVFL